MSNILLGNQNTTNKSKRSISNEISRLGVNRYKVDAKDFLEAIEEAENPYYPNRVKMQEVFRETFLNPQVQACWNRRKSGTMLKKNVFKEKDGNDNQEWTSFFNQNFFRSIKSHILDAQIFGYSLINWDEVKDNKLINIRIIKRENVLPDEKKVVKYTYNNVGIDFENEQYKDWTLYVQTPSEIGVSSCGYGALLYCAMNEVYLRNTIGVNAEYLEKFGIPYPLGKTMHKEGEERDRFEDVLRNFRSGNYAIIDNNGVDEISILQHDTSGNTSDVWEKFYQLNNHLISKVILGHGSALDSTTGKLGNQDEVSKAIAAIVKSDMLFVEAVINDSFIPKLRNLGFNIPDGVFCHDNDEEAQEEKKAEIEHLTAIANMVKTFKDAGKEVDLKWVEDKTGINFSKIDLLKKPENSQEKK